MNQTAKQTKQELVSARANLEADPDLFRDLLEVDPAFFRDILKENPVFFFRDLLKKNPQEDQAYSIPNFTPTSAIRLQFRHSDYNTLNDKGVVPAVKLVHEMGLRVQGPVFLPSSKMRRIALLLVSGSAETIVRYTKQISNLPRQGVKLDIKLERTVIPLR